MSYPDGTLLGFQPSGPFDPYRVCRMEGGKCHWIPDPATLVCLGFDPIAIQYISIIALRNIQTEAAYPSRADGALLKGSGDPIYLMDACHRRWVPDLDTFTAMKLQEANVHQVADADLNAIPLGTPYPSVRDATAAINEKYTQLGGAQGVLGKPVDVLTVSPDFTGFVQYYETGGILWSPATGAHEVHNPLWNTWASTGWQTGPLGYPTTDQTETSGHDGVYNLFQHGAIYYSAATGAHEVHGPIWNNWILLGFEHSPLGYPTTDQTETSGHDGVYNLFQHGAIYYSAATGAHEVHGPIWNNWILLGFEHSPLGYPSSDQQDTSGHDGVYNLFQHGAIYSREVIGTDGKPEFYGTHEIYGPLWDKWVSMGFEHSTLGYPVSAVQVLPPDGFFQRFQNGNMFWTPDKGVWSTPSLTPLELYGALRATLLSRHFAINKRFRANLLYHSNILSQQIVADELLMKDDASQLLARWSIQEHGGGNPLMESGLLLTCLAVEYTLGNHEVLKIIRAAIQTFASLYKFHGNHFEGYILRWDAVLSDRWKTDGQARFCQDFYVNSDNTYNYCTPFDDPHSIRVRSKAEWEKLTPDERTNYGNSLYSWFNPYRYIEPSQDEVLGLIMGYFIVHSLVDVQDVRDEVKRQLNNLGDYLAEHSYYLVRPGGGFAAQGASGALQALEYPFSRVFERITGQPYYSRNSFQTVMEKADVWKSLEEPFNAFTVAGVALVVLAPFISVLTTFGLSTLLDGISSPAQLGQIWAIYLHREVFNVLLKSERDKYNDSSASEFAVAYALSLAERRRRFDLWMTGTLLIGGTGGDFSAGFPPFVGLTGLDDIDTKIRDTYIGWLPQRRQKPGLPDDDQAKGSFASAVAVLLGAGAGEEQKLVELLHNQYNELHQKWQDNWAIVSSDSGQPKEEFLPAMNYMAGMALAWLHAKRQRDRGTPVTTVGFPVPPNQFPWPTAAVPTAVLDEAKKGNIPIPLNAIQRQAPLQVTAEGADLFLDDPLLPKSEEPIPILPGPAANRQVMEQTFVIHESDADVATGITLNFGDEFEFEASGSIWAGVLLTGQNGPEGWNDITYDHKFFLTGQPNGHPYCLLGKLGEDGAYFYIGKQRAKQRYLSNDKRQLFLRTNDDTPGNGRGSFNCIVRVNHGNPLTSIISATWLAMGRNTDGRQEVFVIGPDNGIYHNWQTAPGGGWYGWSGLGGQAKALTVGQNTDGRQEVFVIGPDNGIYHNWQTAPGGGWYGWSGLGGQAKALTVGQNTNGTLEVFVIGPDNGIYHNWQTAPGGGWYGWNGLGGAAGLPPDVAVGRNTDGRQEVFVIGPDNGIYHNWQTAPGGGWYGWSGLGGQAKALTVGQNTNGTLEVFVIGPDNGIYHNWQTAPGGGWYGWSGLGGQAKALTVGQNTNGTLEVFVIGPDNGIYHNWQTAPGGGWYGWSGLGGAAGLPPDVAVGRNTDGRQEVFVIGPDNGIYHNWQTARSGGWYGWNQLL